MKKKTLVRLLTVLSILLAAELAFIGFMTWKEKEDALAEQILRGQSVLGVTQPSEPEPSAQPQLPTDPAPSTEEASQPTEQEKQTRFVITFTGDSTLGSDPADFAQQSHFILTVGTDYGFPYRNLYSYFSEDDLTLVNLESVLADEGRETEALFNFRAPTEYVKILTESSVEAVTLANNHSKDFGEEGYATTKQTLEDNGVTYVEQDKSAIYTTKGGLVVGLYAAAFIRDDENMELELEALRQQGAQLIIAAMHWGNEGAYRPMDEQREWAYALIDAGVDIVWGNHPHTLQPIEEYSDGIIYYSLANCSFAGNLWPRDMDTAILQQEILLQEDGTVKLGELLRIPCKISSLKTGQNNFQPTPYPEGSEDYDRVLSKLDGSFKGPNLVVDYSHLVPTQPTEPEGGEGGDGGETGGDTGNTGGDTGNTGGDTGNTGGDTGNTGGDTGNTGGDTGSTGGDTGSTGGGDAGGGEAPPPPPPETPVE